MDSKDSDKSKFIGVVHSVAFNRGTCGNKPC
jgi:hypothetical protein